MNKEDSLNTEKTIVKTGKELTAGEVEQINEAFKRVFPENELLELGDPQIKNDIFFFVRSSEGEIVAMGRLRPLKITFKGMKYPIQGISDIISNVEGQGYGRQIIEGIKKYLLVHNHLGLGFCAPHNREFYLKCGLDVESALSTRFYYKDQNGQLKNQDDGVIYFNDREGFTKRVKENSLDKVLIPISHW